MSRRIVTRTDVCQRCGRPIDLVAMAADRSMGSRCVMEGSGEPIGSWKWTGANGGGAYCKDPTGAADDSFDEHVGPGPLDLSDPAVLEAWLTS